MQICKTLVASIMTEKTLTAIFTLGQFSAFLTWTILAILMGRQILKRNYDGLKIVSLYLINSVTFVLAYGLVLKLAFIVMAPIEPTKEKSIEALRNQANSFLSHFILFALLTTCILTILNVVYLKYVAKTVVLKHTVILLGANLTILLLSSYVSTEWYYNGLLQEINRHFN